jgi:hypothetical protein
VREPAQPGETVGDILIFASDNSDVINCKVLFENFKGAWAGFLERNEKHNNLLDLQQQYLANVELQMQDLTDKHDMFMSSGEYLKAKSKKQVLA